MCLKGLNALSSSSWVTPNCEERYMFFKEKPWTVWRTKHARNDVSFSKDKCSVLGSELNNPKQRNCQRSDCSVALLKRRWVVPVDSKVNVSQQNVLATMKANHGLGCFQVRVWPEVQGMWLFHSNWCLLGYLGYYVQLMLPTLQVRNKKWRVSSEETPR